MAVQDTLISRNGVHGNFKENAECASAIKQVFAQSPNWLLLPHIQREALVMIVTKLSRILTGNNNHSDHWHDIAGYATLVEWELTHVTFPDSTGNGSKS